MVVSLDQRRLPLVSNSATLEARGNKDLMSWTYGSNESLRAAFGEFSLPFWLILSARDWVLGGTLQDEALVESKLCSSWRNGELRVRARRKGRTDSQG